MCKDLMYLLKDFTQKIIYLYYAVLYISFCFLPTLLDLKFNSIPGVYYSKKLVVSSIVHM